MKITKLTCLLVLVLVAAIPLGVFAAGEKPPSEAGNNLSYPVIWAEGVAKNLPGTPNTAPILNGAWWYWWGTEGVDPDIVPLSCAPDPDNEENCSDGNPPGPSAPGFELVKAYLQKDPNNIWQAGTADWTLLSDEPLAVRWIDWGDNLESVDWYTKSQVRTEVVLFQDLPYADSSGNSLGTMLEYEMRHVSGWGIDEVHGLAYARGEGAGPILGPGTRATVYSPCARLTIQKLLVPREQVQSGQLVWQPGLGWAEAPDVVDQLVNAPIFNLPVYAGGDGPGYYSAEINVKGRVIYGYTWNVRKLDPTDLDKAGDYRITFSFDDEACPVALNTFFVDGLTEIMVPLEEEGEAQAFVQESTGGGATAVLDFENNLTYMDVRILERVGGGGQRVTVNPIPLPK